MHATIIDILRIKVFLTTHLESSRHLHVENYSCPCSILFPILLESPGSVSAPTVTAIELLERIPYFFIKQPL